MPVDLKEVESSNISKIGYDPETETLYIKFKGGSLWSYTPVPEEKYKELFEVESKGKYFARVIRSNKDYTASEVLEEIKENSDSPKA